MKVADPGFPRGGGANSQGGGANPLFGQNFPENCMQIKEFEPRGGGRVSLAPPLDPPMIHHICNPERYSLLSLFHAQKYKIHSCET